jgi:uncharacterized protein (DUF433 family)
MTTATTVDIGTLIYSDPAMHSGTPCLKGTGMTVRNIAILYRMGQSAEEIHAEYPEVDKALIFAALAYYLANQSQVEADIAAEDEAYERLVQQYPNGWGPTDRPVR